MTWRIAPSMTEQLVDEIGDPFVWMPPLTWLPILSAGRSQWSFEAHDDMHILDVGIYADTGAHWQFTIELVDGEGWTLDSIVRSDDFEQSGYQSARDALSACERAYHKHIIERYPVYYEED